MNTYGEIYGPAMEITDQQEADEFFDSLVSGSMYAFSMSREDTEALVRHNLGYIAGYYDNETRERVERLFKCEHPVFGSIEENGPPTMEAAFQAGLSMGKELQEHGSST